MPAAPHILAIVGRPNVGKSALFNRIVGRRIAIVHEQPGVTRDRISAVVRWDDKTFELVDTGGIAFMDDEKTGDVIAAATRRQAELAIEMASAVILVTDVTTGVTPLDREIARKLHASGKPVLLAVNKVDNDERMHLVDEFTELGFDNIFPVAAIHGRGIDSLLAAATRGFVAPGESPATGGIRLAIVGRPNVGKSSLVNAILQSERTIVSEIPGTTRDAVDVPFTLGGKSYVLVDTAGLRHRRKIRSSVDQFGMMRAERSIRDCDIAVLVLDARDGVTKQDKKIAGLIFDAHRPCIVLVNKWDLAAEQERRTKSRFRAEYLEAVRKELFFLDWAPVIFASAKTGENVLKLFQQVAVVEEEMNRRVDTPELNRLLGQATQSYPPPLVGGRRFKIYYAFQKPVAPPVFVLFVNDESCLTPHYERFLMDRIRQRWGFCGCPLRFQLRARTSKETPGKTRC